MSLLSEGDKRALADQIAMELQSTFRILDVKISGSAKHSPSTNRLVDVICRGIDRYFE